jgi:hypothetical protein
MSFSYEDMFNDPVCQTSKARFGGEVKSNKIKFNARSGFLENFDPTDSVAASTINQQRNKKTFDTGKEITGRDKTYMTEAFYELKDGDESATTSIASRQIKRFSGMPSRFNPSRTFNFNDMNSA